MLTPSRIGQHGRSPANCEGGVMRCSGRTLHLDSNSVRSADHVASREEALLRLITDEYDTIVLHSTAPGHDDFGLLEYLAGTWPLFLGALRVVCMANGETHVWNNDAARFEPQRELRRRRRVDRPATADSIVRYLR